MKIALKEWDVITQALEQGDQVITLRKGGIADDADTLKAAHTQFLFYPTDEHQRVEALRDPYRMRMRPVSKTSIQISVWAESVAVHPVVSEKAAIGLAHLTAWTDEAILDRFRRYPDRPMWLLIMRVHRLAQPIALPMDASYAGCHSWVPLVHDVSVQSAPVLSDEAFDRKLQAVLPYVLH